MTGWVGRFLADNFDRAEALRLVESPAAGAIGEDAEAARFRERLA